MWRCTLLLTCNVIFKIGICIFFSVYHCRILVMAPPRQPRSLNKRHSNRNDVSLSNDGDSSKKNMQRKRKYSDMLGPQWSKEELESFYDAYREYNKRLEKSGSSSPKPIS
nr:protein ALWAYS EARLY 3-like isoform X1 [Ipomoea batatas]